MPPTDPIIEAVAVAFIGGLLTTVALFLAYDLIRILIGWFKYSQTCVIESHSPLWYSRITERRHLCQRNSSGPERSCEVASPTQA